MYRQHHFRTTRLRAVPAMRHGWARRFLIAATATVLAVLPGLQGVAEFDLEFSKSVSSYTQGAIEP